MSSKSIVYEAKDYSWLRGLKGITDEQIEEHLKLYNGYVKRTNALLEKLSGMASEGKQGESSYQELRRRLGWEFNGMRLHEFYFDQFSKAAGEEAGKLRDAFEEYLRARGGMEAWKQDFSSIGKMPGIGWVVCYQDETNGELINTWIEQHHSGHLAGCRPILILDCFEHAFSVYLKPTQRAQYVDDFLANVNWDVVAARIKL